MRMTENGAALPAGSSELEAPDPAFPKDQL